MYNQIMIFFRYYKYSKFLKYLIFQAFLVSWIERHVKLTARYSSDDSLAILLANRANGVMYTLSGLWRFLVSLNTFGYRHNRRLEGWGTNEHTFVKDTFERTAKRFYRSRTTSFMYVLYFSFFFFISTRHSYQTSYPTVQYNTFV